MWITDCKYFHIFSKCAASGVYNSVDGGRFPKSYRFWYFYSFTGKNKKNKTKTKTKPTKKGKSSWETIQKYTVFLVEHGICTITYFPRMESLEVHLYIQDYLYGSAAVSTHMLNTGSPKCCTPLFDLWSLQVWLVDSESGIQPLAKIPFGNGNPALLPE